MEHENNNDYFPFISGNDPNTIDYYIEKLIGCNQALIPIRDKRECFNEAKYNARNKEMLCIYMLLDNIQSMIADIKATNTSFKFTTEEGKRAIDEVIPDFLLKQKREEWEES